MYSVGRNGFADRCQNSMTFSKSTRNRGQIGRIPEVNQTNGVSNWSNWNGEIIHSLNDTS